MADDYLHLAQSYATPSLFRDHFASWWARVPVWSVATYALFASHALERSWCLTNAFFLAHSVGIALLTATMMHTASMQAAREASKVWIVAATAVACFYSNAYEILYWPTCMSYTLGALFLGLGAYVRPVALRVIFFCLAALTYETFVLPMLVVVLVPALPLDRAFWRRARFPVAMWSAVMLLALTVRVGASRMVGSFHHGTNFDPWHILRHAVDTVPMLVRFKHYHMPTSYPTTTACLALLALCLWKTHKTQTTVIATLLVACVLSAAVYWVLAYSAMRAIYGSQVLFCAILAAATCLLGSRMVKPRWLPATFLVLLGASFVVHHHELWQIKAHNATVLREREASLREALTTCEPPCRLSYPDLQEGLQPDWVMPGDFVGSYLEWLRLKYAANKQVEFVPG